MGEKSEIAVSPNIYKDTLDYLINSSDTQSPNWSYSPDRPGLIDKGSRNAVRPISISPTLLEEDRLDEDVPVTSLELTPNIQASQVYQRNHVAPLSSKSGRAQYENSQNAGEDGKGKRDGENGKRKRGRGGH